MKCRIKLLCCSPSHDHGRFPQVASVFLHYFRGLARFAHVDISTPGADFYYSQQANHPDKLIEAISGMYGTKADSWEADLSDTTVIPQLFDRAEETLGPVAVLVNNAAHWDGDTFLPSEIDLPNKLPELWTERPSDVDAQIFDRMFNVNTTAPALLMAEFARLHVARQAIWGRIINVSTAGAYCFPSEISYGASKYALESYTRSAAAELGRVGITVNTVAPGPVQTGWITVELERQVVPSIPLGRLGTPEDIADVIVFLASHQARWVTGQKMYVGGGMECSYSIVHSEGSPKALAYFARLAITGSPGEQEDRDDAEGRRS